MATATKKTATTRKADLTVSLCIAIDHQAYAITPIRAEDPDIIRAFRLEKKGGDSATYDVAEHALHGLRCDCADWTFRRDGLDPNGCNHVIACVRMGLLEAAGSTARAAKGIAAVNTPACCPSSEPRPCTACASAPTVTDTATVILERGTAIARDEINRPLALPDRYPGEAPELTPAEEHEREPFDLPELADPGDIECDPELWPDGWDDHVWNITDADAIPVPSLSLADLIEHTAGFFAVWPTDAGKLIADTLRELAGKVQLTEATTPDEYSARIAVMDDEVRETWEAIGHHKGYEQGLAAGRREANPAGAAFGHSA